MTRNDTAEFEHAQDEDALQHSLQIAAAEESADRAVEDTEINCAKGTGRHHDHDDAPPTQPRMQPRRSAPDR